MSAHADKTLHSKIFYVKNTDTFPPCPFLKNVIFSHESVHEFMCELASDIVKEFFTNFAHEIKCEICTNLCGFV